MLNDTSFAGSPADLRPDAAVARRAPPAGFRLTTLDRDDAGREAAEQFIARGYLRSHRACVRTFLPQLLALTDAAGDLHGAVGCRRAGDESLFLERYLDAPVEEVLSSRTGIAVERAEVVELGNFACRTSAVARRFMSLLPRFLLAQGASWIVFTGTRAVRGLVAESGARLLELAAARPDRVAGTPDEWGRYYDTDPRVMAGYLPLARGYRALWKALDED